MLSASSRPIRLRSKWTNCWIWPGPLLATPDLTKLEATGLDAMNTNCGGPNDATLMVRRAGEDTNDLTVTYNIGGTASNGVDYVLLPGTVTVPAGESYAFINIVPLDNPQPAAVETVVLTLEPSASKHAAGLSGGQSVVRRSDYTGQPIEISANERVSARPVSFHFSATGPDGAWFCIEHSIDLINWTPISTNHMVNGSIDFVDLTGRGGRRRGFYQAVPEMNAPTQ